MKNFFNLYTLSAIVFSLLMFNCAGTKTAKVNPYVGDWEYTIETPDGNLDVTMSLGTLEQGYFGSLNTDMGSVDLYDLEIEDGKLTTKFDFEGSEIPMQGTFEGETFTGSFSVSGYDMPVNATKVQAAD